MGIDWLAMQAGEAIVGLTKASGLEQPVFLCGPAADNVRDVAWAVDGRWTCVGRRGSALRPLRPRRPVCAAS